MNSYSTLNWEQFKKQSLRLIELSNIYSSNNHSEIDNFNWHWNIEENDRGFLVLKFIKSNNKTSTSFNNNSDDKIDIDIEEIKENDVQSLKICSNNNRNKYIQYEYHVVYSSSYQVPVLYLNLYNNDTSSFISWDDIWNLLPLSSYDKSNLSSIPWISQVDHPYLGIPFYQLHPCETANLMKQVLDSNRVNNDTIVVDNTEILDEKLQILNTDDKIEDSASFKEFNNTNNYLLSWLSIVGPLVGINVPKEIILLNIQ